MTDAERIEQLQRAVISLAEMVSTVAARSWAALGTTEAQNINRKCMELVEGIEV